MIFVTVGTMLPFDRLIRFMDAWASQHRDEPVIAQIGESAWIPQHMRWERLIGPSEFRRRVEEASIVVSHAGMGSVLTARDLGKPIIILPRLAARHEVTTDHQVATARWLSGKPGIFVARSENELTGLLASVAKGPDQGRTGVAPSAQQLIDRIRAFIEQ